MAATQEAPAKGSKSEETKEPTREELAKAALKRAGMSQDLKSYEKDQIDRAASVSPQRRGKSLKEFITSGEKAPGPPRDTRQIEWDTPFKKGDSPGYIAMLSKNDGKSYEFVGTFQGVGVEGEKNLAKVLGVSFPEGLRDLVAKKNYRVLSMNARYVNLSAGATVKEDQKATA